MDTDIHIKRAILHILDTNAGIPVLSETLLGLPLGIQEYLFKHLTKAMKDPEIKRTQFTDTSGFFCQCFEKYKKDPETLVEVSQDLARLFFDYMTEHVEVPPADLLVVEFTGDRDPYLGILKMNYKHSYIHYVDHDGGMLNDILRQPCCLPTEGQRLEEFVIINVNTRGIFLKEKKYEIDGHREYYLSTQIVQCREALSEKQTFDIVEKAAKRIIEREYNSDVGKLSTVKQVMAEDYETDSAIDIGNIARAAFGNDTSVGEKFKEEVAKRGIVTEKVPVTENIENKIFKKQKFITDSGIEIAIPTDYLTREDIVEFKNNPDGTVSVEIKNIEAFQAK
ncbi:MAG: nucleoid-associated protein [Eubacterium sp.]|nr:nucleoid-associated protein [Eubacterium sp.]